MFHDSVGEVWSWGSSLPLWLVESCTPYGESGLLTVLRMRSFIAVCAYKAVEEGTEHLSRKGRLEYKESNRPSTLGSERTKVADIPISRFRCVI